MINDQEEGLSLDDYLMSLIYWRCLYFYSWHIYWDMQLKGIRKTCLVWVNLRVRRVVYNQGVFCIFIFIYPDTTITQKKKIIPVKESLRIWNAIETKMHFYLGGGKPTVFNASWKHRVGVDLRLYHLWTLKTSVNLSSI